MLSEIKTHNKYSLKYNQPNHLLRFGSYGIKATSFSRISKDQLELIEWTLLKKLKTTITVKKTVKIWNLVNLNLNLTKLSLESRMGKGKGNIYTKAAFIKPGTMLFEFDKISFQHIKEVFKFIQKKTPVKIILVSK